MATTVYMRVEYTGVKTLTQPMTYVILPQILYTGSTETYMTQYPSECLASTSQNGTYIATSPGGLYTMYANGGYTSLGTGYIHTVMTALEVISENT